MTILNLHRLPRTVGLLIAMSAGVANADEGWVAAANSRLRLNWCGVTNSAPTPPGAAALAYLEMQLDPGWKTYWRMPGDSGVPPSFDWKEAPNVAKATVYYPAPHRMADQGGEAVGYKDHVVFPIRIERRDPKQRTPINATLEYGICKNICVPVEVKLTAACYGASPSIAAAVDAVPRRPGEARATDPKLLEVIGSVTASPAKLTIDVDFGAGVEDADVFVEAPDGLFVPLPKRATPDAKGRASFAIDLSKTLDPKDLLGKELRVTMVSSKGAAEAFWIAK